MSASRLLCDDELSYLSGLFRADRRVASLRSPAGVRSIPTTTELPALLPRALIENGTFTLLAEVGQYKLSFPVELKLDTGHQLSSVIGVPEVLEAGDRQRSWRWTGTGIRVQATSVDAEAIRVQSVSCTGIALQLPCERTAERLLAERQLELQLPDGEVVVTRLDPVRRDGGMVAARIEPQPNSLEALRRFLFQKHRARHARLYRGLRLPTAPRRN